MNAERAWLDAETAAEMIYPPGWRKPVTDEIAAQDERNERRRDADEHPGASNGSRNWEDT